MLVQTSLFSQNSESSRNLFKPHFVYLEDCYQSVKHIYLDFEVDPLISETDAFKNIDHLVITPKWDDKSTEDIVVEKMLNGFEIDIFDQQFEGDRIEFDVLAYGDKGEILFGERHAPLSIKEHGITDVSVHLDQKIAKFQEDKGLSMSNYFCGEEISRIQLLAFFRDYLNLSHSEMCAYIYQYNLLKQLEITNQVQYIFTIELCDELEAFLDGEINPGDGDACNCNLIRTNRTALNVGTASTPYGDQEICTDYDAKLFTDNFEFGSNEDDLIVNGGRMGAAKGLVYVMQYNNGKDSPDQFESDIPLGWSELSFRSVCVDPVTITPNIENCASCIKDIELQYGYYTQGLVFGKKDFHTAGSKLGMRLEEWAAVVVQQDDEAEIIDEGAATYLIDCDAPNNTIEETLTDLDNVISTVGTAIGNVTVGNVGAAAVAIISFIEDNILAQFCNQIYNKAETLMAGTHQFTLLPNGYFKAVITSGAAMSGKTENNGRGFININSDFYMAAIVETVAPANGEIPEYCECERIGAYVLGSMDGYTPLSEPIRDDNPIYDMTEVFQRVPMSDFTLRQIAGTYIGSFGPWAPKWDQQGCCSAVNLECQSECAYLAGCNFGEALDGSEIETRAGQSASFNLEVSPNPSNGNILLNNSMPGLVEIYSIDGQTIFKQQVFQEANLVLNLQANMYFLRFTSQIDGTSQVSKIVID